MSNQPQPQHLQPSIPASDTPVPVNDRQINKTRLLLVCHAEGMHNRYHDLTNEDSGLTALGWQQAESLAFWLRSHIKIDVLVSGSQLHSRLTAQRVGQALGLPISIARDLPGQFQDTDGQLTQLPHAVATSLMALTPSLTVNDATMTAAYVSYHEKLVVVLNRLLAEHEGKTIALIASRSAIATTLRHFFGGHTLPVQIDYSSISELYCENGRWLLYYVNRREHEPLPVLPQVDDKPTTIWSPDEDENLASIAQVYNDVANSLAVTPDQGQMRAEQAGRQQRLLHLLRWARLPEGLRILDIGSGMGILTLALAEQGAQEVVGTDISLAMLEQAEYRRLHTITPSHARVSYRLAPAQMLPFSDARFDTVVCRMVLHEAHKPERILSEIVRVLKPGGFLLLGDLLGDDDAVKRATQNAIEERRNPCHVAARSMVQYRSLLRDVGLHIEREDVATFERAMEEWLRDFPSHLSDADAVREMFEASMETDAAGMKARRQGGALVFDQQMVYIRAVKP